MCIREKASEAFTGNDDRAGEKKKTGDARTRLAVSECLWITAGRRDRKQLWHSVQTLHICPLWSKMEFYSISNSIQGLLLHLFAQISASV